MLSKNFQYFSKKSIEQTFSFNDLKLRDYMTLGQNHDTPSYHKRSLCDFKTTFNGFPQGS